ncbi:hypothetical protein FRC16_010201, partial [Serendipita sp. 398]
MLCTKAKALSWSIYLGLFVVLATIPLTWVLWAKKVKFEHDIGQMITEVGRGNQSGLFLLGSLVHVDLDEAKVLIRMFILACGARYLSPFNEYSEWAVVEEEKHVNCDIPIIPVVVYDFLRRDVIGYHNPAFKWFEIGDNISHSIPFGTFFEAEFKIEKTETSPSASLLVPDPAYRYPHDLYVAFPTLSLYDNSTNTQLPFLSFPIAYSANSFIAEVELSNVYNCVTDNLTNFHCRDALIRLKRTYITKSIAILALVTGWLLTGMTVIITIIVLSNSIHKSSEKRAHDAVIDSGVPDSILVLPIATILAIPALRSLFPSAPPTGILY